MGRLRTLTQHQVFRASTLRVLGIGLGVAGSVAIARLGGADTKGVSSAFAAANSLIFLIVNLDLAQQLLRDGRQRGDLSTVVRRMTLLWPFYFLAGLVGCICAIWWGGHAIWLIVGAGAYLVGAQAGMIANALAGPSTASLGAVIQQATMVLGAFIAWWSIGLNETSVKVVVILAYLTPVPLFFWSFRRAPQTAAADAPPPMSLPNLVKAGTLWQGARLSQFLMLRMDTLVVFSWLGAAQAGIYSVGLATASLASLMPGQFAANTTYEATLGETTTLRRNAVRAAVSGLAAAVVLTAIGYPLLYFMYGPQFVGAYGVLLATLPGVLAYGVLQVVTAHRRLVSTAKSVTVPSAVGACVMAVALAVLVPPFALVGAGAASSIGSCAAVGVAFAQSRGWLRWSM